MAWHFHFQVFLLTSSYSGPNLNSLGFIMNPLRCLYVCCWTLFVHRCMNKLWYRKWDESQKIATWRGTDQKCVTSLMYLLDAMECPDYGFKSIMEWARKCFEAGFDFNPRCKTRLGNLNWMYSSIHNAEQIMPHLEPIDLPEPLRDMTSMNVICYDFVPQCYSLFCKIRKWWRATIWCWTPTILWRDTSRVMIG